jgi:hypothetical protein
MDGGQEVVDDLGVQGPQQVFDLARVASVEVVENNMDVHL